MDAKLEARLQNWKGEIVKTEFFKAMGRSVFEMGIGCKTYAKKLCPVKKGRLRASISMQMVDTESGFGEGKSKGLLSTDKIDKPGKRNVAKTGTAVPYAMKIEYGRSDNDAQPFLRPALSIVKGEALRVVEKNGRLALEKV